MFNSTLRRTLTAQRERPFDWIGVLAGESLELLLEDAIASEVLRSETAAILRFCLPGLEQRVERTCLAGMQMTSAGLDPHYGFPCSPCYPVVISVLQATGNPARPVAPTTMGGIIECWPQADSAAKRDWYPVIAATARGGWPAVSLAVTAKVACQRGASATIRERFAAPHDPAEQLVVMVLAAGDADYSVGFAGLVTLPGLQIPADAIRINLAGAA
jgi:hypothetical protein